MRKKPQQKRSRQMVDSLIEATAKAVIEKGLDGLTTHYIADKAGVSVGSLYQYFDDKEAMLEALIDKLTNEIVQSLHNLPMSRSGDLQANVEVFIQFGFSLLNARNGLYLELVRNWQSLPTNRVIDTLQQSFMELSRLYFLMHYQDTPIKDLPARIFIIANSVMFTMMRYIEQPPMFVSQQEVIDGLTDMVVGYLQKLD